MARAVDQFMAKVTSAELRFVGQGLASALRWCGSEVPRDRTKQPALIGLTIPTMEIIPDKRIDDATLPLLQAATNALSNDQLAELHTRWLQAREAAMVAEIRRVCGIQELGAVTPEDLTADEVAADVQAGEGFPDEEEELEDLDAALV